jgi:hypothetical protein
MNPQLLLTSLKVQDGNLDELADLLEIKKNAVVQNDFTTLEQAISEEQKILKNIEQEESNRIKIIKELAGLYSMELPSPSMENFVKHGKKYFTKELKEIEKIRKSIAAKIGIITQTNIQLKLVVDFSRSMIKETILMIVGPNKRALVNKRV